MKSVFVTYTGTIAIVAEESGACLSIKLLKKILLKEKRNLSLGDNLHFSAYQGTARADSLCYSRN